MRYVLVLMGVLGLAPLVGHAADDETLCDHSGAKEAKSPDGKWVATVQEIVCAVGNGAAAGVMVDLKLVSDPSHMKRVFSMRVPRSRDYWPRVIWKSASEMELWAPNRAEISSRLEEAEGVRIELKYCGDNPDERAAMAAYQAAFKKWMADTTAWVQRRKADPSSNEPRPQRPSEPMYSNDSCANIGS